MRLVLIVILTATTFSSFGQQRGAYDDGTKVYYPYERFSISASPLALLQFYSGSAYKAGFSFRPDRKFRITADGGGFLRGMTSLLTPFDNMKGYHFRGTIGASEDFFPYTPIGFGVAYDHMRQNFNYNSRTKTDATDYTASVSKFSHLFNGYANLNLHFGWRFYVELRAEFGLGYYEVSNSHNELLNDSEGFESNWSRGRVEDRKEFNANIALNVRFNYSLWVD